MVYRKKCCRQQNALYMLTMTTNKNWCFSLQGFVKNDTEDESNFVVVIFPVRQWSVLTLLQSHQNLMLNKFVTSIFSESHTFIPISRCVIHGT